MNYTEAKGRIRSHGYSGYKHNELLEIAKPIFENAKRKIKELENAGLTYSPAYKGLKDADVSLNISDYKNPSDLQKLRHALYESYLFTEAKTSTVAKTKKYWAWLEKLVDSSVDEESREDIGELIGMMRKYNPYMFQKFESTEAIEEFFKDPSKTRRFIELNKAPNDELEQFDRLFDKLNNAALYEAYEKIAEEAFSKLDSALSIDGQVEI